MNQQKKIILAIDYGLKRIGLAISRVGIAEPLAVLQNTAHVYTELEQICQQEQVELVLVGESEGKMAENSKKFALKLQQKTDLPTKLVDETLSSQTARQKLAESQASLKKRKGPIDHFAAASFLQEWLQTH